MQLQPTLSSSDRSLRWAIVVGLGVMLFAFVNLAWLARQPITPAAYGFASEHGNIAGALATRGEFSDSFGIQSGPTAWEPPLYPAYLALVFLASGTKTAASLWVLVLMDGAWAGLTAAALAFALHRQGLVRAAAWLPFVLALQFLLLQRFVLFGDSPTWLIAALGAAFLVCWSEVRRPGAARGWWWALLVPSALLPILHLGCGLAALVLLLGLIWRARRTALPLSAHRRWLAGAILALLLPAGLWTLRNRAVLGTFFPVKSNGWFELWLSQEHTRTGILSAAAVESHHPCLNSEARARYARLGEARFVAACRREVAASLRQDPARYLRFLGHRLINATVFTQDSGDCAVCRAAVPPDDLRRLQAAGLGVRPGPAVPWLWTSLDLSPVAMPARLVAAGVQERRALYADWLGAHECYVTGRATFLHLLASFSLSGIPVACALIYLALKRRRTETVVLAMVVYYFVALAPNILVTHDETHQLLHLGLLASFMALPAAELPGLFRRRCSPIAARTP